LKKYAPKYVKNYCFTKIFKWSGADAVKKFTPSLV